MYFQADQLLCCDILASISQTANLLPREAIQESCIRSDFGTSSDDRLLEPLPVPVPAESHINIRHEFIREPWTTIKLKTTEGEEWFVGIRGEVNVKVR